MLNACGPSVPICIYYIYFIFILGRSFSVAHCSLLIPRMKYTNTQVLLWSLISRTDCEVFVICCTPFKSDEVVGQAALYTKFWPNRELPCDTLRVALGHFSTWVKDLNYSVLCNSWNFDLKKSEPCLTDAWQFWKLVSQWTCLISLAIIINSLCKSLSYHYHL